MRELLRSARAVCKHWLPVHVHRELNTDPDRLSHPSEAEAVIKEMRVAGKEVVRLDVPEWLWSELQRAAALPPGKLLMSEPDDAA